MNGEAGRTAEMIGGSESAREPVHVLGYRKTSVLDYLQPSGNGMSGADRQRQMFGIKSMGQDEGTADKSMWLKNPSNPSLYNSASFG